MNIERRRILDMVSEEKINADEAERLIDALSRNDEFEEPRSIKKPGEPKYLRVLVDDPDGDTKNVRVKIPLQLIRAGVVHQDVHRPEGRPGSGEDRAHVRFVRHVP